MKGVEPSSLAWKAIALPLSYTRCFSCLYGMFHWAISFHWCFIEFLLSGHPFYVMGSTGFEPVKALPSDLQSDPFDRSGNSPSQNVVVMLLFADSRRFLKLASLFFSFNAPFSFLPKCCIDLAQCVAGSVGRQSLRPVSASERRTSPQRNVRRTVSIRLRRELAAGLEPATC